MLPLVLLLMLLPSLGSTQTSNSGRTSNTTALMALIPQLRSIDADLETTRRPISVGGQEFSRCCRVALIESLAVQDGHLVAQSPSYLDPSLSALDFEREARDGNFPCAASYRGNASGSPIVRVPYSWCVENCNGWQVSHRNVLAQWIGPVVGFILPSVAFCLMIPRSWRLGLYSIPCLFSPDPMNTASLISWPVRLVLALFAVIIDTVLWLAICFAMAGPMLVSSMLEAYIDHRMLHELDKMIRDDRVGNVGRLSFELRAKLLVVVLVGNLELEQQDEYGTSTWDKVEGLTARLGNPPYDAPTRYQVRNEIKGKLASILASQSSFGMTAGAPVVFFAGAFVYTVIDIMGRLGDNDTAHALAFGMWWMIIPNLAIVSGLLLASNNPSALAGFAAPGDLPSHGFTAIHRPYNETFRVVGLWRRGYNKWLWYRELVNRYARRVSGNVIPVADLDRLQCLMKITTGWAWIYGLSLVLILTPCMLAMFTSYFTPRVGLSCRSLTFLVYFCAQFLQMTIWVVGTWRMVVAVDGGRAAKEVPGTAAWAAFIALEVAVGAAAVFSGVGGTFMQMIGVYRNCRCKIPVQFWARTNDPQAYVTLSSNTAESIAAAGNLWQPMAISATVFLCVLCAFGWWWQRRLRLSFQEIVSSIDKNTSWEEASSH